MSNIQLVIVSRLCRESAIVAQCSGLGSKSRPVSPYCGSVKTQWISIDCVARSHSSGNLVSVVFKIRSISG